MLAKQVQIIILLLYILYYPSVAGIILIMKQWHRKRVGEEKKRNTVIMIQTRWICTRCTSLYYTQAANAMVRGRQMFKFGRQSLPKCKHTPFFNHGHKFPDFIQQITEQDGRKERKGSFNFMEQVSTFNWCSADLQPFPEVHGLNMILRFNQRNAFPFLSCRSTSIPQCYRDKIVMFEPITKIT